MFYTQSDRMFTEKAQGKDGAQVPLHNTHEGVPVAGETSGSDSDEKRDGTWGERDEGGPVNLRMAMEDFEEMRQELTHLTKTRTEQSERRHSIVRRPTTGRSRQSNTNTVSTSQGDLEAQTRQDGDSAEEEDDFELDVFLKDGHFEKRQEGRSAKKVGVVYKNLTVQGVGATATFVKTLPSAVIGVSTQHFVFFQANIDDLLFVDFRTRFVQAPNQIHPLPPEGGSSRREKKSYQRLLWCHPRRGDASSTGQAWIWLLYFSEGHFE